jgi:hypothetical protein
MTNGRRKYFSTIGRQSIDVTGSHIHSLFLHVFASRLSVVSAE